MKNVIKTVLGLCVGGGLLLFLMSAGQMRPNGDPLIGGDKPVIKRLSTYRGDHFPGFAEFRVQEVDFKDLGGEMILIGEPYDLLLNVTYITSAYRYEDSKKTDYSTIVFTNYQEGAILVRQPYKDVISSIRKGMEALSK